MRVIDADRLQKQFDEKSTNPNYRVNMHNIKSIISNTPTVEAILKADYENRLKADMVAMLTDIQLEIEELNASGNNWAYMNCSDIIQQKIDALKAEIELQESEEVEDYKEELTKFKKILGNIHYLSLNIDPCDQKSDANVRKLQGMTSQYECFDYDFKNHADQGIW